MIIKISQIIEYLSRIQQNYGDIEYEINETLVLTKDTLAVYSGIVIGENNGQETNQFNNVHGVSATP